MSAVPDPAGATAVIFESEFTVKLVAAVDPKVTEVANVNPMPLTVTLCPGVTQVAVAALTELTTGSTNS
jgi:hypothetical protein